MAALFPLPDVTYGVIWSLGLIVLTVVVSFIGSFYLTFDEDGARLAGINTKLFNNLLLLMTASIVAVGMRIIGALLISSLFVLPVAASLVVSYNFKSTLIIANMVSVFSVYAGIILSYFYDVAPGSNYSSVGWYHDFNLPGQEFCF